MSVSIANRASAIRHYLNRPGPPMDLPTQYRYSIAAARWEALRLLIHDGKSIPADDRRFRELSSIVAALTVKLGLETGTGPDAVPGITRADGFLPLDPERILSGATWQTAAQGW